MKLCHVISQEINDIITKTPNLKIGRYFHILQSSSIDFTSCEKELSVLKPIAIKVSDLTPVNKLNVCIRNLASFPQIRLNLYKGTSVSLILKL